MLNGKAYNKCYIDHYDLMNGGMLELFMGSKPNLNWGRG
jgi:putative alpha-1,2-mannosidase